MGIGSEAVNYRSTDDVTPEIPTHTISSGFLEFVRKYQISTSSYRRRLERDLMTINNAAKKRNCVSRKVKGSCT